MVDVGDISVEYDCRCCVLAVRYFDASAVRAVGRLEVPAPLRFSADVGADVAASCAAAVPTLLAWRSPTDSLLITQDIALAGEVEVQWRDSDLGCCVVQSDGMCIMRLQGARIAELLLRLGAPSCVPGKGEARTSRIGDLVVLAVGVREHDVLLAVERVFADHLHAWLETTLADF